MTPREHLKQAELAGDEAMERHWRARIAEDEAALALAAYRAGGEVVQALSLAAYRAGGEVVQVQVRATVPAAPKQPKVRRAKGRRK